MMSETAFTVVLRRAWRSGRASCAVVLALACATPMAAQSLGRIEGTVTDSRTQRPLPNATVYIESAGLGAQTNENGHYALVNVPAGRYEVGVRRIGYTAGMLPVTVEAGQTTTQNFHLLEVAVSLDQIVVTGTAAAQRAKEVPTSTNIVSTEQFERAPVANPQQILAGRVPSVTIEANSGQPGAGGSIKIRGTNTVTQSVEPLIYVDGVRIFNELTRNNYGARTASSPLQDINAADIERIEVVKGAAATTLYGTEASGGVIQIFTKRGQSGKPQWDAQVTTGANVSSHWGDRNDPTQLFVKCGNTSQLYGITTSGSKVGQRRYFVDPTCPKDGTWTDPGLIQQYSLSVRGGTPRVTYFVSGNYGDVNGILQNQNSKDGGFRGNFSFFPFEQVQLTLNTAYLRRNTSWTGDGNNSEGFLLNVGRGPANYLKGGKGNDCAGVADTIVCVTNGYVFDQTLTTRNDHYLTGLTLNFNPTSRLSNRFAVGWDYTAIRNVTNLPFGFLTFDKGYFWDENTNHTKLSLDYAGSLQSHVPLARSLESTFSWGGQLFRDRHRWTEIDVQNFAGRVDPTLPLGSELTYRNDLPYAVTNAGFFLQEQLAWRDQLFVTGGLRVDGSSAFGENFGLSKYPKFGLSYVLSEHSFWPTRLAETFKLRGAVGESGKAPGAFDRLRTWRPVTGDEDKPGLTPSDVGNPNVGPERTREIEGGFDAGFLHGRLGLEATWFLARTLDALIPVLLPPSQGFTERQIQNIGELKNSGAEFELNAGLLRTRQVDWRARGSWSRMHSQAVNLGPERDIYTGLNSYVKRGFEFPMYFGKVVTNPNANAEPIVVDTAIGLVNPDRLWGLGTTVTLFNKLTLDGFVEHQGGFYVQNYTAYQNARRGVWQPCYGVQEKMVASWGPDKKAGTADDVPSMMDGVKAIDRARCRFSGYNIGFWTEKGDFTKLRYVSLTYVLPPRLLAGRSASLTIAGRNLYTWTDYHGADPEVQDFTDQANLVGTAGRYGRRDYYQIPQARAFTVSLRTSF